MLATNLASEIETTAPSMLAGQSPAGVGFLDRNIRSTASRVLQAREHVFFEGDPIEQVYQVLKGTVCIYMTLPDGRRQIVDFAHAGDFIGLGEAGKHAVAAQAITLTKLRCLPARTLHEVARHDPQVAAQLYRALSNQLAAARNLLLTVGRRSATERLATLLLALSRRNERMGADPACISLPMSRSDIADFLSLTIETVSRSFTKLRQNGTIDLVHSTLVHIRDRRALEQLCADEAAAGR
jgi:CRP/FNR family transcriptional regulator